MSDAVGGSKTAEKEFGKIQSLLWPIHGYEMKKFVPMSLLMFFILFVYTMLRDIKDVFIQKYAVCGGTELIPVLKLVFVMPAAFLMVMLFTYLVNKFGNNKTFYILISIFLIFYAIFLFLLFPNVNKIHPGPEVVRGMQAKAPGFLYYVIPCITNWSYTLFYVMAEIWGTISISSLFWQFANKITKKNEVKRFYGVYSLIGNFGVIFSGATLFNMSRSTGEAFNKNVKIALAISILSGLCAMATYYYINHVIMTDPRFYDPTEVGNKPKKEKVKMGVMDGIKFLFKSRYLLLIAVLVVAYGVSINFLEVIWKEQLRVTFPDKASYSQMMATLSITVGIFTIISTIVGSNLLRRTSWKVGAAVTPFIILIFGGAFFCLALYQKAGGKSLFGVGLPLLICWIGLITDALSKSVKYCLFDTTKSMAYIPLDPDTKTKGQAAVEVIGGRAGKAGASSIQYVLTNMVRVGSKISAHLTTIVIIFSCTVVAWIYSVFQLSKEYEEKNAKNL